MKGYRNIGRFNKLIQTKMLFEKMKEIKVNNLEAYKWKNKIIQHDTDTPNPIFLFSKQSTLNDNLTTYVMFSEKINSTLTTITLQCYYPVIVRNYFCIIP